MTEQDDKVKLTILSKSESTYACHVLYEEENIHDSLDRNELIQRLMEILTEELPEYSFKLEFRVQDGKFINELEVVDNGTDEQSDTSDTLGHQVEKDIDRGDRRFPV